MPQQLRRTSENAHWKTLFASIGSEEIKPLNGEIEAGGTPQTKPKVNMVAPKVNMGSKAWQEFKNRPKQASNKMRSATASDLEPGTLFTRFNKGGISKKNGISKKSGVTKSTSTTPGRIPQRKARATARYEEDPSWDEMSLSADDLSNESQEDDHPSRNLRFSTAGPSHIVKRCNRETYTEPPISAKKPSSNGW